MRNLRRLECAKSGESQKTLASQVASDGTAGRRSQTFPKSQPEKRHRRIAGQLIKPPLGTAEEGDKMGALLRRHRMNHGYSQDSIERHPRRYIQCAQLLHNL